MLIHDIDLLSFDIVVLEEIPMTKLHYRSSQGWATIHVPNDQIARQLQAWDEAGVDYAMPA